MNLSLQMLPLVRDQRGEVVLQTALWTVSRASSSASSGFSWLQNSAFVQAEPSLAIRGIFLHGKYGVKTLNSGVRWVQMQAVLYMLFSASYISTLGPSCLICKRQVMITKSCEDEVSKPHGVLGTAQVTF